MTAHENERPDDDTAPNAEPTSTPDDGEVMDAEILSDQESAYIDRRFAHNRASSALAPRPSAAVAPASRYRVRRLLVGCTRQGAVAVAAVWRTPL